MLRLTFGLHEDRIFYCAGADPLRARSTSCQVELLARAHLRVVSPACQGADDYEGLSAAYDALGKQVIG